MIVTIVGLTREKIGLTVDPLKCTGDLLTDVEPAWDELWIIILDRSDEFHIGVQSPEHGIFDEIRMIIRTVDERCAEMAREEALFVETTKTIADQSRIARL